MTNLSRRVTRIEEIANPSKVVVMWRHHTESDAAALARWEAANPGRTINDRDLRVIIVRWADPQTIGAFDHG